MVVIVNVMINATRNAIYTTIVWVSNAS